MRRAKRMRAAIAMSHALSVSMRRLGPNARHDIHQHGNYPVHAPAIVPRRLPMTAVLGAALLGNPMRQAKQLVCDRRAGTLKCNQNVFDRFGRMIGMGALGLREWL